MRATRASEPILLAIDVPLGLHSSYIGVMEKKLEATGIKRIFYGYTGIIGYTFWDYIGIMEKQMKTTIYSRV